MKLEDDLVSLIEPDERAYVVDLLRCNPREKSVGRSFERLIIRPLEQWVEAEFQRMGRRHHNGTEAGLALLVKAEDIASRYRQGREVYPEHINLLERQWTEWLETVAQGLTALSVQEQQRKSDGRRRAGINKKGKRSPFTKLIESMVEGMDCERNHSDVILAELEADALAKENAVSGLREDGVTEITVLSASHESVTYRVAQGKEKSITVGRLRTLVSEVLNRQK